MAIPKNKTELIEAIESSYSKLVKELTDIPERINTANPDLEGHRKGTKMSVENLLSYLIGWGELVLKWNHQIEHEQAVVFPETNFTWNELGLLAQKFYLDYQDLNFDQLLVKFDDVLNQILALVKSKTDAELYQTKWYKHYPMGRMIQLNTSSPYKNARSRIRKWKRYTLEI